MWLIDFCRIKILNARCKVRSLLFLSYFCNYLKEQLASSKLISHSFFMAQSILRFSAFWAHKIRFQNWKSPKVRFRSHCFTLSENWVPHLIKTDQCHVPCICNGNITKWMKINVLNRTQWALSLSETAPTLTQHIRKSRKSLHIHDSFSLCTCVETYRKFEEVSLDV